MSSFWGFLHSLLVTDGKLSESETYAWSVSIADGLLSGLGCCLRRWPGRRRIRVGSGNERGVPVASLSVTKFRNFQRGRKGNRVCVEMREFRSRYVRCSNGSEYLKQVSDVSEKCMMQPYGESYASLRWCIEVEFKAMRNLNVTPVENCLLPRIT